MAAKRGLDESGGMSALVGLAALVIVVAGVRAASQILVPIACAAFMALLLGPVINSLRRFRIPPVVSIPSVALLCLLVMALMGGVVGQSVNSLISEGPKYQARVAELAAGLTAFLAQHGVRFNLGSLAQSVRPASVLMLLGTAVSQVASVLSYVLLVLLMAVFLLFDALDLPERLRAALGAERDEVVRFGRIADEVKHYLVLKTYLCLFSGFLTWVVLAATGVDFAPLWGLLAVLVSYVPNIGPFLAAAPPVFLALLSHGLGRMSIVLVLLSVLYAVIGNVVEPNVLGKRLGISSFAVFISLIVWGWLWGITGMLLSVPLTIVMKIMLENSERWRWLAVFLEPSGAKARPASTPTTPGAGPESNED
jgi:AI-2 transport protein TqsA